MATRFEGQMNMRDGLVARKLVHISVLAALLPVPRVVFSGGRLGASLSTARAKSSESRRH
jgi:hypothetical protein